MPPISNTKKARRLKAYKCHEVKRSRKNQDKNHIVLEVTKENDMEKAKKEGGANPSLIDEELVETPNFSLEEVKEEPPEDPLSDVSSICSSVPSTLSISSTSGVPSTSGLQAFRTNPRDPTTQAPVTAPTPSNLIIEITPLVPGTSQNPITSLAPVTTLAPASSPAQTTAATATSNVGQQSSEQIAPHVKRLVAVAPRVATTSTVTGPRPTVASLTHRRLNILEDALQSVKHELKDIEELEKAHSSQAPTSATSSKPTATATATATVTCHQHITPPLQHDVDYEEFIHEVKLRPILWRTSHNEHKNKILVKRHWDDLQVKKFPEFPVEELKKKWKNLKDQYRKEIKKKPQDGTPSSWRFFEALSFLRDEVVVASNNGGSDAVGDDEDPLITFRDHDDMFDIGTADEPEQMSTKSDDDYEPQSKKSRSMPNRVREQMLLIERQKLKIIEEEVRRNAELTKSDNYHFFMSILPEMDKLPVLQKMRFRSKVTTALIEELQSIPEPAQQVMHHVQVCQPEVSSHHYENIDTTSMNIVKEEPIIY